MRNWKSPGSERRGEEDLSMTKWETAVGRVLVLVVLVVVTGVFLVAAFGRITDTDPDVVIAETFADPPGFAEIRLHVPLSGSVDITDPVLHDPLKHGTGIIFEVEGRQWRACLVSAGRYPTVEHRTQYVMVKGVSPELACPSLHELNTW